MTAIKTDNRKGTISAADCFMPATMTSTAALTIIARDTDENELVKILLPNTFTVINDWNFRLTIQHLPA